MSGPPALVSCGTFSRNLTYRSAQISSQRAKVFRHSGPEFHWWQLIQPTSHHPHPVDLIPSRYRSVPRILLSFVPTCSSGPRHQAERRWEQQNRKEKGRKKGCDTWTKTEKLFPPRRASSAFGLFIHRDPLLGNAGLRCSHYSF